MVKIGYTQFSNFGKEKKMRTDLADITLIVDRSGSMVKTREEAEGGINAFIKEQAELEGNALLTLVQFDTVMETVHKGVPIEFVPTFSLEPRGLTALLDAVGKTINETGIRLANMMEADRPALVVFGIITDGLENSSHEFTKDQIKTMIEKQTNDYNWQFTFLGANQDAFAEAVSMGIPSKSALNYQGDKAIVAYSSLSSNISGMRGQSMVGASVENKYTDKDRTDNA